MRYMLIIKATRDSESGVLPGEDMLERMTAFHEELARAGVLVDATGLRPSASGWRVEYRDGHRSFVDGPFAETKEIIAGFTIIRVANEAQARAWTLKLPNPALDGGNCHIEVRQLYEMEDLGPSAAVERFQQLPTMHRATP